MKDLGEISYFLGISFKQGNGVIKMNQKRYIQKILDRFGMSDCQPRTTPCEQRFEGMSDSEQVDPRRYREIVGSLIYLMTCTRPDIGWVVSKPSAKMLWPYAVQTAAHIRNRCYNNRTKSTPYFSMTGRKPVPVEDINGKTKKLQK